MNLEKPYHHALRGPQGILIEQVRSIWLPTRVSLAASALLGMAFCGALYNLKEDPGLKSTLLAPFECGMLAAIGVRIGVELEGHMLIEDPEVRQDRAGAWLLPVGLAGAVGATALLALAALARLPAAAPFLAVKVVLGIPLLLTIAVVRGVTRSEEAAEEEKPQGFRERASNGAKGPPAWSAASPSSRAAGACGGAPSTTITDTKAKASGATTTTPSTPAKKKKKSTAGGKSWINRRIPSAPTAVCLASFACYVALFLRGLRHVHATFGAFGLTFFPSSSSAAVVAAAAAEEEAAAAAAAVILSELLRDVSLMAALYGIESLLALGFEWSTLAGWRPVDFLLHHLPYAVVVGGAAATAYLAGGLGGVLGGGWGGELVAGNGAGSLGAAVVAAFPRTLALTLLTCPNEAVTILFAVGLPRTFDAPNRLYLLLVMLALIPVELAEIAAALLAFPPRPSSLSSAAASSSNSSFAASLPLRIVALLTLGAPAYHAWGVVPCCWKKLRSTSALYATAFEDAAANNNDNNNGAKESGSASGSQDSSAGNEAGDSPQALPLLASENFDPMPPALLVANLKTVAGLRRGDKLRCWCSSGEKRHSGLRLAVDRSGPLQGLRRLSLLDPHRQEHRHKNIHTAAAIVAAAIRRLTDDDDDDDDDLASQLTAGNEKCDDGQPSNKNGGSCCGGGGGGKTKGVGCQKKEEAEEEGRGGVAESLEEALRGAYGGLGAYAATYAGDETARARIDRMRAAIATALSLPCPATMPFAGGATSDDHKKTA